MAEIRKHTEKADGLAAAVRAAIGDDIRPAVPGAKDAADRTPAADVPGIRISVPFLTKGAESFLLPQHGIADADDADRESRDGTDDADKES